MIQSFCFSAKKSFSLLLILSVSLLLNSCKTSDAARSATVDPAQPNQDHLIQATLWYQHAAEYRALAFQAYNMAKDQLDKKLKTVRYTKQPCIVLDLDETCLDNSPYAGYQIKSGNPYSRETWQEWTSLGVADSIPGCVSFLKWVDQQNVPIFYVSNRRVSELEPTMRNMKNLGFPQVTEDHVMLRSDVSNKQPRRDIIEKNHVIVMFFGDNLNDFSEEWEEQTTTDRNALVNKNRSSFGYTYIIIPNPGYGSWEGALYNYERLSGMAADSARRANVSSFR